MHQPLYHARKSDNTEKGSRYTILQDGPASFHVSVQNGDFLIYEHFEQPESLDALEGAMAEANAKLGVLPTK